MAEAIVDLNKLVKEFPSITKKSQEFAKRMLPLHASPKLAAIAAALMTDGHIDWYTSDGRPRTRKIVLYSSNKEECEWFLHLVKKKFCVEGKVQAYTPKYGCFKKQPYKATIYNAVIARILILAGIPVGDKTKQPFLVPDWVMRGSREIKREFLRTFFNFEGSFPSRKRDRPHTFQMSLRMNKEESFLQNGIAFFSQIKTLLNSFNVHCSNIANRIHNHSEFSTGKRTIHFSITAQESIVNFYFNIGFLNSVKQAKLEKCAAEIARFHRIKSGIICGLMDRIKETKGTDKKLADTVNKFTVCKYTSRQIEHFRRQENKVPLEIISALIKISNEQEALNQMPEYVKSLLQKFSARACL